jgi:hypothetical protein
MMVCKKGGPLLCGEPSVRQGPFGRDGADDHKQQIILWLLIVWEKLHLYVFNTVHVS